MRQKRARKKPPKPDRVFKFPQAGGGEVTIGDAGKHRDLPPEKLSEAAQDQEKWAGKAESPFVQESPQLAALVRARREIPDWRQSVAVIKADLRKHLKPEEREFLQGRLAHFQTVLAEMLAVAGEYEEAAQTTPVVELRKEYRKILKAIDKPDDAVCKCKKTDPTLKTEESVVRLVWSNKHSQMMPVVRCNYCDSWNVKSEPSELSKFSGLRRRAEQLTEGQAPGDARQTLERAKHETL